MSDLSLSPAGLLQGVERLQASHHAAAADLLADSQVLQPANFKEAQGEGDPRDWRTSHLREPQPGHRDPVGVQGQKEAATTTAAAEK